MNYAGFWKRAAAAIIDGVVTMSCLGVLFFLPMIVCVGNNEYGDTVAVLVSMLLNILAIILTWLYYAIMESSRAQGTLGKMALGIKVTDLQGGRIGFGKATGRYFGKIVSYAVVVGIIMVGFTQKKQGLHDLMAGCLVVAK